MICFITNNEDTTYVNLNKITDKNFEYIISLYLIHYNY